nr:hypothetical protein [Tanacetum cinerariifolium]
MANNPEEIATGSITQLTRVIIDGISMSVSRVMVNDGNRFGSQMLVNGVSSLVPQGLVNGVMANDVGESVGQGVVNVVMPNGVSGSTAKGMDSGGGVMANGVSGSTAKGMDSGVGVRDNAVSVLVSQGMVSGVRANGVSESTHQKIGDGIMANGVREPVRRVMVNGVRNNGVSGANRESVYEVVVDASSSSFRQAACESVDELDKERLLYYFNQEVVEDLGRLSEYHSIARGLKFVVQRRRERIRQLQLLRNCQDAATTIRVWEQMQLEDVEKGLVVTVLDKRAIAEDSNLAREIDGLCAGLTARIEETEYFIDELDVLADRFVPEKMAEFMKENQEKDRNRLMRLQILGREFELRADEKKHFIRKLNGNLAFVDWHVSLFWTLLLIILFSYANSLNNGMVTDLWSVCEDYRLASKINRVATEVNNVTMQRECFLEELDSLGSSGLRRFFRYAMLIYSCYLCYVLSLYPFTECFAQPYFFSCLIRQGVDMCGKRVGIVALVLKDT